MSTRKVRRLLEEMGMIDKKIVKYGNDFYILQICKGNEPVVLFHHKDINTVYDYVRGFNLENKVVIHCVSGCLGDKDACMPEIISETNRGKEVFILYSNHIKEKLEEIGDFNFRMVKQNDIPVGIWITKKSLQNIN